MPRMRPFHSRASISLPRQHGERLRENAGRTPRIRIRERRASDLAHAQMIMLMGICVEGEFKPPQTCDAAQLRTDQRHHMIPALERFIVGICVVPLHNFPELPSIDWFEEVSKDATTILHARHFLSLDNLKVSVTLDSLGMRRGIVNHSPDTPAASGR